MAAIDGDPWNGGRSRSISFRDSSRNSKALFPPAAAVADYSFLRDRGYPSRPAVDLVGDRYRLPRRQRTILYRGVCSIAEAEDRLPRIASRQEVGGAHLILDGYNVLLILYHYLVGYPVFLCRDGLVRDAGLSHGRSARKDRLADVAGRLFSVLLGSKNHVPARVTVVLDEAVSHSKDHAGIVRQTWSSALERAAIEVPEDTPHPSELLVILSPRADATLVDAGPGKGCVGYLATSDSQVIERSSLPIVDLPRWTLEESFGVDVEKLRILNV